MPYTIPDDLAIPAFLRISPEEAQKRKDHWQANPPKWEHPPTPVQVAHAKAPEADTAALVAAIEEEKRIATANRIAKMKEGLAAKAIDTTKMRWDTSRAKWVPIQGGTPVTATKTSTPTKTTPTLPLGPPKQRPRGGSDTKHATMMSMLLRPEGATKPEIAAATGWEPHTAGARISGIKGTHNVLKTKETRGTVYRAHPKQ